MPLWNLQAAPQVGQVMRSNATISTVNVPTGGSAHTMGAWTTLIAATTYDIDLLMLRFGGYNATGVQRPCLISIGVGANPNEYAVIPYLDMGFHAAATHVPVRCFIPKGVRISAQAQGYTASTNIAVTLDAVGTGATVGTPQVQQWDAIGVATASSQGTSVTPGNSNAWGNWASLGTLATDYSAIFARASMGNNSATTAISYRVQVAAGASTTEATAQVTAGSHIEAYSFVLSTAEAQTSNQINMAPLMSYPAKSGLNLYARAMASGTAQTIYVTGYGGR